MSLNERQISDREIKIAATSKLTRKGNTWIVPSQAGHGEMQTRVGVEYTLMRETTADGQTVVTKTVKVTRKTYTQNWPAYNAAQTHEKSELQALLYELCRTSLSRRSAKAEADHNYL